MQGLVEKLRKQVQGEVLFDDLSRRIYSVDASLYEIMPVGVVIPRSKEDVLAAVAAAAEAGVPVIARGAATGLAGGCIGAGLIIDFAKYLNHVTSYEPDEGFAICEPGVVQDQLNAELAEDGYRFGPDTSTGNRATLGGMLGNNSSGAHSLRYGKTVDNVLETEVVLSNGETIVCSDQEQEGLARKIQGGGREGEIYQLAQQVRTELAEEINQVFPKLQRRVSGYNLDELLKPGPLNLSRLIVGSEGTLGVATELKVRIVRNPGASAVVALHCQDLFLALDQLPMVLEHQPFAVELMDRNVIARGRESPVMQGNLDWLEGDPDGLLAVEFDGENQAEVMSKLERFGLAVDRAGFAYAQVGLVTPADVARIWALRKAGLGLLTGRRTRARAIPFVEDVAVPPERLGAFAREFRRYFQALNKELGIYGHAGVGLLHFRPMMDLRQPEDLAAMVKIMEDISDLVKQYGGAVSGEHGDGLARSWLVEKMFGKTIYRAFKLLKSTFDPEDLMNPGKIVNGTPPTDHLRLSPDTPEAGVATAFSFGAEGGLCFAVEMCNGDAECRKCGQGLMCPSFEVTEDERDCTRARATALQAVLHGQLGDGTLATPELLTALDHCLACKGCRKECPANVDMAKLKSEVLWQYQERHGVPLRSRLVAAMDTINVVGSLFAPLSNWGANNALGKKAMAWLGFDRRRRMLPFTRARFSRWYRRRTHPEVPADALKVLFLVDTHVEHNFPELGQAMVAVLEALGCQVATLLVGDCGRPAISKGLLDVARRKLTRVVHALAPYVAEGYVAVGLEPSYVSALRDEAPALVLGPAAENVAPVCLQFSEFMDDLMDDGTLPLTFTEQPAAVWVHGHCHQKASCGTTPALRVLRAVPGLEVHELNSGCCGMAGSFGYEHEHYEFSMKVGEARLFPALRALPPDAVIVADGVSCRTQIKDGTGRVAHHLVEVLAARLPPAGAVSIASDAPAPADQEEPPAPDETPAAEAPGK